MPGKFMLFSFLLYCEIIIIKVLTMIIVGTSFINSYLSSRIITLQI